MPGAPPDKIRRLVDRITGLPTLPTILSSLNTLMVNPRTSAREVAQLISSDPALTSKVLRVVNSSFYGFPNRISTVTHAIVILGFNTVKSIVLSTSIFDALRRPARGPGFDRNAFWKHSIAVGACSRVLARRTGYAALEEFFIAGLLHDTGKIILDSWLPEDFARILRRTAEKDCLLLEAEQEELGLNHADLGGWLLQKWNLSEGLVSIVANHHNPEVAGDGLRAASIVHLADILARSLLLGSGGDRRIPAVAPVAWEALDLKIDAMGALLTECQDESDRAMIFLEFAK